MSFTSTRTTRSRNPSLGIGAVAPAASDAACSSAVLNEQDKSMSVFDIPPAQAGEPMSVDIKEEVALNPNLLPLPPSSEDVSDVKTVPGDVRNMSKSPSPAASSSAGPSKASTPASNPGTATNAKKGAAPAPQLIGDLPLAREAALKTFTEIKFNNYQYKTLGRSREVNESMTCDCVYDPDVDPEDTACGPYSDCINRLTQVECLAEDCRCRGRCQNQRFQKRQYGPIDIVLTEKKGFGLRAEADIPKDTFIYEYVGDVVNPASFKKRMRDYAEEGIQHFYFMMLQKDEFIDATKSGGIGRFANHSCNPNCYVAKWTVGTHVRMGIFSKRFIQKHEELTFNYNVDRYGHQAQTCYCGEPNCVGYIGGKTQTDVATMDDLYLDALGITDEDDVAELKGTKKKKGKKIDDPDFMPTVKPVVEKEVPKVIQAIMQTSNRKVLYKLLGRIKITVDQAALRQIMRLRGYSMMKNVLDDYAKDGDMIELALQCLTAWPLLNRNKVDDSQIWTPVQQCLEFERDSVKELAQKLMDHWQSLPLYNRIPKRALPVEERATKPEAVVDPIEEQIKRRRQLEEKEIEEQRNRALRTKMRQAHLRNIEMDRQVAEEDREAEAERRAKQPPTQPRMMKIYPHGPFMPSIMVPRQEASPQPSTTEDSSLKMKALLKAVIANATEKVEQEEKAAIEARLAQEKAEQEKAERRAKRKERAAEKAAAKKAAGDKDKEAKRARAKEEKEANKEKRLTKLVGAVVVKCMSKYAQGLDRDYFKKYAKELTHVIVEKEKRSSSYKDARLDALSEDKINKIKKFSKEYIGKVMKKWNERQKAKLAKAGGSGDTWSPSTASVMNATAGSSSTHTQTPNSVDGRHEGDLSMHGPGGAGQVTMSVEEAMDLDSESESEDDGSEDEKEHGHGVANGTSSHPNGLGTRDQGDDDFHREDRQNGYHRMDEPYQNGPKIDLARTPPSPPPSHVRSRFEDRYRDEGDADSFSPNDLPPPGPPLDFPVSQGPWGDRDGDGMDCDMYRSHS